MAKKNEISSTQRDALIKTLRERFAANTQRHRNLEWNAVESRLKSNTAALRTLNEMEKTGGEPDVIGVDEKGRVIFVDCSAQSPSERRSLCYDKEALDSRKEAKPKGSAVGMATAMGAALMSADEYKHLQTLGEFDTKTSSWVETPAEIRMRGGAIFCDRRYDTVFIYHNGAESYYAARGFRCVIRV